MKAGISLGMSILLKLFDFRAWIACFGTFLIKTEAYLSIISFLVFSSVISQTLVKAN